MWKSEVDHYKLALLKIQFGTKRLEQLLQSNSKDHLTRLFVMWKENVDCERRLTVSTYQIQQRKSNQLKRKFFTKWLDKLVASNRSVIPPISELYSTQEEVKSAILYFKGALKDSQRENEGVMIKCQEMECQLLERRGEVEALQYEIQETKRKLDENEVIKGDMKLEIDGLEDKIMGLKKVKDAITSLRVERERKVSVTFQDQSNVEEMTHKLTVSKQSILKELTECSTELMEYESGCRGKEMKLEHQRKESIDLIRKCKLVGQDMDEKIRKLRTIKIKEKEELDGICNKLNGLMEEAKVLDQRNTQTKEYVSRSIIQKNQELSRSLVREERVRRSLTDMNNEEDELTELCYLNKQEEDEEEEEEETYELVPSSSSSFTSSPFQPFDNYLDEDIISTHKKKRLPMDLPSKIRGEGTIKASSEKENVMEDMIQEIDHRIHQLSRVENEGIQLREEILNSGERRNEHHYNEEEEELSSDSSTEVFAREEVSNRNLSDDIIHQLEKKILNSFPTKDNLQNSSSIVTTKRNIENVRNDLRKEISKLELEISSPSSRGGISDHQHLETSQVTFEEDLGVSEGGYLEGTNVLYVDQNPSKELKHDDELMENLKNPPKATRKVQTFHKPPTYPPHQSQQHMKPRRHSSQLTMSTIDFVEGCVSSDDDGGGSGEEEQEVMGADLSFSSIENSIQQLEDKIQRRLEESLRTSPSILFSSEEEF